MISIGSIVVESEQHMKPTDGRRPMQGVSKYEATQNSLALLEVLALTNRQVEEGRTTEVGEAFARLRNKLKA